ncbi:unnamed protein product [Colias eurytheme]|nr:unnamed protein product [Colias eurytheme]
MFLLLGIVGLAYAHPSVECPTDGKQYLLPHEYDCSKFYSCVQGRKQDQASDCPVNTLFSFETQRCDATQCNPGVEDSGINNRLHKESPLMSRDAAASVVMFLLLGIVGLAYAHPNVECPTDGKQYLLPHEYDCSKFYSCVQGRKQDQASDCPVNTLFSFETQRCDATQCNPGVEDSGNNNGLRVLSIALQRAV